MDPEPASVHRLYVRLAEAMRRTRRHGFEQPVTVAEIYQELVPYRAVRSEAGFALNADYEHALLRLLSGEGGYLRIEPTDAADAIRLELHSPNPNVTMYRTYAACDVWVAEPGGLIEPLPETDAATDENDAEWTPLGALGADIDDDPVEDMKVFAFDEPAAPARSAEPVAPPAPEPEQAAVEPERAASSQRCAFCDSSLPAQRAVRFCPWCGGDQTTRPCGSCGEVVEVGWSYCVACGAAAD